MGLDSQAEQRLYEAFAEVGFISGGEFYVPTFAARSFVDACLERGLAIVGIEVFTLVEKRLRPDLGLIADFSRTVESGQGWQAVVSATVQDARSFLEGVPTAPDQWLNFTLLDAAEAGTAGTAPHRG